MERQQQQDIIERARRLLATAGVTVTRHHKGQEVEAGPDVLGDLRELLEHPDAKFVQHRAMDKTSAGADADATYEPSGEVTIAVQVGDVRLIIKTPRTRTLQAGDEAETPEAVHG